MVTPGGRLVFADDFDRPPSVSRDGIGADVEIAVEHVAGKGSRRRGRADPSPLPDPFPVTPFAFVVFDA